MRALPGKIGLLALIVTLSAPLSPILSAEAGNPRADSDRDRAPSLLELARSAGTFETLLAALDAAELDDALAGQGPFTVFAPTDEAFAQLPVGTVESLLRPENRERLVQILTAHVATGDVDAASALRASPVASLEGSPLDVRLAGGRLQVNEIPVVANDLRASNGTIHVIDGVILPPAPKPKTVDPNEAAVGILTLAIERGVPLFNEGQEFACVAIYELAMRSLVDRPGDIDRSILAALEESLRAATQDHTANAAAWTLRGGIDRAIQLQLLARTLKESAMVPRSSTRLFDFDSSEAVAEWFSVNDDVMGGISQSRMVVADRSVARFEGALSLENNGGFATIRSRARDLGLAGAEGLRFRVRGDGRTYRVSALTGDRRSQTRIWKQDFPTVAGEWQELFVPFESMVLSVMGRRFPAAGPVSPEAVRSISFGIADKDESPFSLEIDWIEAVVPADLSSNEPRT